MVVTRSGPFHLCRNDGDRLADVYDDLMQRSNKLRLMSRPVAGTSWSWFLRGGATFTQASGSQDRCTKGEIAVLEGSGSLLRDVQRIQIETWLRRSYHGEDSLLHEIIDYLGRFNQNTGW